MSSRKRQNAETSITVSRAITLMRRSRKGIDVILCWACIFVCTALLILLLSKPSFAMDSNSKVLPYVLVDTNDNNSEVMNGGWYGCAAVAEFGGLTGLSGLCLSTLFFGLPRFLPAAVIHAKNNSMVAGHMYPHPRAFYLS